MFLRTLMLACFVASSYSALWNLFEMKKCVGGRNLFEYNGYGCSCGLRLDHKNPVDDVDRCCVRQKGCYNSALESGDCKYWFLLYFILYDWKCVDESPVCSEETTNNSKDACTAAICNCDSQFINCLAQAPFSYPKPICPSMSRLSHIDKGSRH